MLPSQPLPEYRTKIQTPRRRRLSYRQVRRIEGASLWLAMLMLLFVQPLFEDARATERQVEEGTGEFHYLGDQGRVPAPVLSTDYKVTVTGLIAETRLRQSFGNTSDQWQEGVYTFPLPENASVHAMTMTTDERVIVGEIRERQQARREYEQAKQEGRQAARVDQQRPNLFTTRLANIPPGRTVTVELKYQQLVRYDSGEFSLRLPTTLTPRYIPGVPAVPEDTQWTGGWAVPTTEVADAHQITPPQVARDGVATGSHEATIAIELQAGLPVSKVSSPSHQVTDVHGNDSIRVTAVSGTVAMDRDFQLRWRPVRGQEPAAAVFHETWQGEDYLLAMLVPGEQGSRVLTRELILVIDTSGSMAGASIQQAREAMLTSLDTLGPGDTFNVIQFNSHTSRLFPQPVTAGADNLERARRYIRGLQANGGTEMASALDAALDGDKESTITDLRQVVFVTDGAVGNEQALFGQIRDQLGGSRLFTVGIGSAPNMHFMGQAARFGRGTYTAISDLSEVSRQLDTLFRKMQSPVLTDIDVNWPAGVEADEQFPARVGDLYLGEPMMLLARGASPEGDLAVSGSLPGGQSWQRGLALEQASSGAGIHRLWARAQIDQLLDQGLSGQVGDDTREQVLALGLRHQLVTPYTSFVATDKTPARSVEEDLEQAAVPSLMPAGSPHQRIGYPQTATPAPLLMLSGLLGLLLSGLIAAIRRWRV
ncbi:marine proteobacterial sortase target protein [Marinobacter zhanjiangensis]|uniref:Marine proteobacterial sortase target protein n=1 Tax=Marinobacter zhanjiangensis TaxID=578215 RepID=A0ABQ3AKA1_9GAMM|nr:marine proteobacterial sortase target protein [Marinobacter zhanjiangensis]GGY58765.1 marine proteobacterial sortase target protein [Marinobacter zhanjiangensis]